MNIKGYDFSVLDATIPSLEDAKRISYNLPEVFEGTRCWLKTAAMNGYSPDFSRNVTEDCAVGCAMHTNPNGSISEWGSPVDYKMAVCPLIRVSEDVSRHGFELGHEEQVGYVDKDGLNHVAVIVAVSNSELFFKLDNSYDTVFNTDVYARNASNFGGSALESVMNTFIDDFGVFDKALECAEAEELER